MIALRASPETKIVQAELTDWAGLWFVADWLPLPIASNQKDFSHLLSVIGFWKDRSLLESIRDLGCCALVLGFTAKGRKVEGTIIILDLLGLMRGVGTRLHTRRCVEGATMMITLSYKGLYERLEIQEFQGSCNFRRDCIFLGFKRLIL
jgi:hypothetical protein